MARVISDTVLIQPATPAITETKYILTLSKDEAQVLKDILARVGGCPYTTRRNHTNAISNALEGVGIFSQVGHNDPTNDIDPRNSSIYFLDKASTNR